MTSPGAPAHFLLVEDEPTHADLVRYAFEDNHIVNTLDHVEDGEEAMAYLRQEGPYADAPRPDVILLDLKLPKLDGHEVLALIKADPGLRSIPVVVLTTSGAEHDRTQAFARHANSFITKPVDFDKFQQMVRDLSLYWTMWNRRSSDDDAGDAGDRRAAA